MNIIPDTIRVPGSYNEVDDSGSNTGLPAYRQPLMVVAARLAQPSLWTATTEITVGTRIRPTAGNDDGRYYIATAPGTTGAAEPTWPGAGGSVTDGTVTWREFCDASKFIAVHTPTRVFSSDEAAEKSGAGSLAHLMAKAAFDQFESAEVHLNLVDDDAAGVCATSSILFAGTGDGPGTVELRTGTRAVRVAWADGDTAAEIVAALDAAYAAVHELPATPYVLTGTPTTIHLLAKNAGVPGNELGLYDTDTSKWEPVVTITGSGITATVTGWASGATNPDITDALDAATAGHFALVPIPYRDSDNVTALSAYLDEVSDYVNCRGARAWMAITSTIAAATTLAAVNDKRLHVVLKRKCKYLSFEIAAAAAVMHAQTGHAALPLNRMEMLKCDASDVVDKLEGDELEALLWAGVTPFNDDDSGYVRCVRSISTYQTNAAGSPHDFYLDTTVIANLDYSRAAIRAADLQAFSQSVLRENHVDGEPEFVATPEDVNSLHFSVCKDLERNGNMQMVDFYKDRFRSVRSATVAGRVDCDIPVEVVQGLHIIANQFRIVSSVGR